MSEYIDNFIRQHKEHFSRNKRVISTNKWYEQDNLKNKKSLFDQENELTSSILGRLSAFIKETESNGDRKLKKVQTFIDNTVKIINIHLNKSRDYLNYNLDILEEEVETEEEIEHKSNEILFQDYIFNKKIGIEDTLNNLNITNSIENVTITFYKNEKATLPMKEVLPLHNAEIKELTERLNLSDEIHDYEFYIHKEQRGDKIPMWDEKKHYWEQNFEVLRFWNCEWLKIKRGFTVDGYFIHPWLYYHLNFYKTPIPINKDEEPIINPSFRDNEWYVAELLKKAEAENNKGICLFGSRRFSKALRDDQIIYYTDGSERPIGNAKEGDIIYGSDGKPTKILNVSPQGKVDIYELTLQDGRKSYCCEDHLWTVFDYQAKVYKTLPLKEMIRGGYNFERQRVWKGEPTISVVPKYFIPMNSPVQYPEKKLNIDPYYLGLWLGDGTIRSTTITTIDAEIKEWLKGFAEKENLKFIDYKEKENLEVSSIKLLRKIGTPKTNNLLERLRDFGVCKEKHIPEIYLKASEEQRMELLRGLMDTDGTIGKTGGGISFSSASDRLAEDVYQLCLSLGIACFKEFITGEYIKKNGELNTYYKIVMFTTKDIFKLQRKLLRIDPNPNKSRLGRMDKSAVVEIKKVGYDYATCIRVDNESKEFLTNNYLVTHNSVIMSSVCDWKALIKANATTSITSGSSGDLEDLTSKIKTSMKFKVPAFVLHIQKQDWEKGATEMGLKVNAQTILEHSRHTIKNLESGAKSATQKTAGGAPSVYLIEEIGKFAWEKPYLAAIPSFETPFGFKTTVIAVGCVCAGTRVWTNKGALVNIEDLKQVQGILGYNGDRVNKEPITWMKEPQKKECVRITTAGGYEIECSVDHPFLMSTAKKINQNIPKSYFKRADQIQVGDSLFKPEKIDVFGTERIDDARLMGLLIGDGYYGRNTPSLSIGDEEIYNYVNSKYTISTKKEFKTKKGGTFREVIISGQVPLMNRLGMSGQTKKSKQIPKEIFESDEWTVTEFLAGYFDADGYVGYSKTKKMVKIVLTSVNKHLLEDVSYLLTKIGIYSTINKEYNGYGDDPEYKGKQEYCYNLYINRVKDVKEFSSKITLLCKHKEERIKRVFDREYKHHSGFKKELRFKYDEEYKKGGYFKDGNTNNLNAVRVSKIEYIGEKEVYNLTAGDTNTYIANGFITHNTSGEASLSGDAMKAVTNPKSFKFLDMDWDMLESKMDKEDITWKRRGFASFIPGQMGYKTGFKRIERRFGDFLGIDSEYLNKITILQTDWKNNKEVILAAREEVKNDPLKHQQEMVQYPIDPEECFLSAEKNIFPHKEARLRKEYLEKTGLWDRRRDLVKDAQGKIHANISNKPLAEFPHIGGNIDAPYLIFEDIPTYVPPQYVYVAGGDFYKQEASDTDSVGTIYIHKYDIFADEFAHKLVASYSARPEKFTEFYENCLLLLEAYNAVIFPENEDLGGFQTFLEKKHLEETYLVRNIDFSSTLEYVQGGRRKWGWTPANSKQKLLNLYANYTKEPVDIVNEDGEIITIKRVQTIDDIGLLSEMINYTKDGNFDRITAAMGSIGFLHFLQKNYIYPKGIRRAMRDGEPEEKKPTKKRERSFYTPPKKRAGFYKSRR